MYYIYIGLFVCFLTFIQVSKKDGDVELPIVQVAKDNKWDRTF